MAGYDKLLIITCTDTSSHNTLFAINVSQPASTSYVGHHETNYTRTRI